LSVEKFSNRIKPDFMKLLRTKYFMIISFLGIQIKHFSCLTLGKRWDVRLELFRQFKTDYVRQLEGVIFEKQKSRLG